MSEVARNYQNFDAETQKELSRIANERNIDVGCEIRNIELRNELIRAEEPEVKNEENT